MTQKTCCPTLLRAKGVDAVDARDGLDLPRWAPEPPVTEGVMREVGAIGLDLAKPVFQLHGADASGRAMLSKRLRRAQLVEFFGRQPRCVVAK